MIFTVDMVDIETGTNSAPDSGQDCTTHAKVEVVKAHNQPETIVIGSAAANIPGQHLVIDRAQIGPGGIIIPSSEQSPTSDSPIPDVSTK